MEKHERMTELTLKRIGILLEIRDADLSAIETAKMLAEIYGCFTSSICFDLPLPSLNLDLLMRSVCRKAEETLLSIITLVEADQDYYAMPLLRPLCEEYLLAEYLCTLDRITADEIIKQKTNLDILKGIDAQKRFFPEAARAFDVNDFENLPDHEERTIELQNRISTQRNELKDLGKPLGWKGRDFPSASFMAGATDNGYVYDFFYRASSSAVHASLHHLGRMVWSDSSGQNFSVDNKNFAQYYGRFALTYGSWLTCMVVSKAMEYFQGDFPEDLRDSFNILSAYCIIPPIKQKAPKIVTEYELRWGKSEGLEESIID